MKNIHEFIHIENATENNLKHVTLDIPKQKFIVITGPSGSGKSTLAFDTIYMESRRRYLDTLSMYAAQKSRTCFATNTAQIHVIKLYFYSMKFVSLVKVSCYPVSEKILLFL